LGNLAETPWAEVDVERTDRVVGISIITIGMLMGYLLVNDGQEPPRTEVAGEALSRGDTTTSTSAIERDERRTTPRASTEAEDDAPDDVRATSGGLDLAEASPTAPPQEPVGVYRNGKLVLRGSVPSAVMAEAYAARAATVLGADNVTVEMTLDARVMADTLTVDVDQEFRFPSGGIVFDAEYEALLNLGVAALQLLPEATLIITGHTDDVGDEGTNLALSQARAQVVVDWMVDRGISPERVVARAAGETEPIADNTTPGGREANRRVEAVLEGIKAEAPR